LVKLLPVVLLILAGLRLETYRLFLVERVLVYAVLALGLNIFMGLCGQANFGVSGFAAIGAFGAGLLEVKAHLNPLVAVVPAVVIAGLVGYLLSHVLLRLRDMSLALGTIAFALAVYQFLFSVLPLSWGGGTEGLALGPITLFGYTTGPKFLYFYMAGWAVAVYVAYRWLESSRVGRAWKSIRFDEVAAAACGINCQRLKRQAFVLNALVAGLGGTLFIQLGGYAAADSFNLLSNLTILLIVVVGGEGSAPGAVVGATIFVVLGEVTSALENYPTLIFGLTLFVIVRFLPRGLWYYVATVGRWLTRSFTRTFRDINEVPSPVPSDEFASTTVGRHDG
jgi:branched-chain amino acid transport system permease protein